VGHLSGRGDCREYADYPAESHSGTIAHLMP
jgi:hypothetical protein